MKDFIMYTMPVGVNKFIPILHTLYLIIAEANKIIAAVLLLYFKSLYPLKVYIEHDSLK